MKLSVKTGISSSSNILSPFSRIISNLVSNLRLQQSIPPGWFRKAKTTKIVPLSLRMVLLLNFSSLLRNLSNDSNLMPHLSLQRMRLLLLKMKKKQVIRCPKKAFRNSLFSLSSHSAMSLPMTRIFYIFNLRPHSPLKPQVLLCPQLVVKPRLLVVKNRIP